MKMTLGRILITEPTITQTFLKRVKISADQIAFRYRPLGPMGPESWREVTFSEFYGECRDVSFGLMAEKIKRGDRIALLSNTRYEWSLSDMAILGAAAITVPIYASSTPEDIFYILNHSESKLLIVENPKQLLRLLESGQLPATLRSVVLIDSPRKEEAEEIDARLSKTHSDVRLISSLSDLKEHGKKKQASSPALFPDHLTQARPSDILTICYTSGTTGTPKGAMITHGNLMSVLRDCIQALGRHIQPRREIILSFLPFSHILGKVESMAIYPIGWKQAFAEGMDRVMANLQEIRPTLLFAVPRTFEKAHQIIRSSVRNSSFVSRQLFQWACQTGADFAAASEGRKRPPAALLAKFLLAKSLVFEKVAGRFGGRLRFAICGGAPLSQELGEFFRNAGFLILEGYGLTETCAPVSLNTPDHIRFGTVGRPLSEVTVKIADDGELLIRSDKLFRGYFKMPEETQEAMLGGWFHTGDIGTIDEQGFVRITDRKKDIIVTSAGKNIAPQKIENMVKAHKLIEQFVLHGDQRNYLTALVTLDREQIIGYANQNHILFSEYSELVKNPRVITLIQRVIDSINKRLASYETVKKFAILPNEFSIETGELTPSLKVRRRFTSEKYKDVLDSLYQDKGARSNRS